jgi:hypothetical protein
MHSSLVEKFEGSLITDEMLSDAAKLFSSNYGVWGPLAKEKVGVWAKQGEFVFTFSAGRRMSDMDVRTVL